MSFAKAKKALAEIRAHHISAHSHPVEWDLSVALEQMCIELDSRLSQIESNQRELAQLVRHLK